MSDAPRAVLIPHTVPAPRSIPMAPSLLVAPMPNAPRVARPPRSIPMAPSLLAQMSNKNRPNSFKEEVESNKDKEKGCCCSIM